MLMLMVLLSTIVADFNASYTFNIDGGSVVVVVVIGNVVVVVVVGTEQVIESVLPEFVKSVASLKSTCVCFIKAYKLFTLWL